MKNEILQALHEGFICSPRIVNFNTSLKSFLEDFGGIFEVDKLTPGLAKDYYKTFLIDYRDKKRNESSFLCDCGQKFQSIHAKNGHKKKCKL